MLLGFYLYKHYPTWDVLFFAWLVCDFIAGCHSWYIMRAGIIHQEGYAERLNKIDAQQVSIKAINEPKRIPNLNELYSQVVPVVKFNKVRRFASTLLAMRAINENKIDLREDTWRTHFGGRDGYIKTRARFESVGAFTRKDARPNSPYIVCGKSGWYVVEQVAHGNENVLQ